MVAGDHDRTDTGLLGLHDGRGDLGADRVDHAGQAAEHQIVLEGLRGEVGRGLGVGAVGEGQDAQGLVGHGLVGGENLLAALVGELHDLAVVVHMGAQADDDVGSALGELLVVAIDVLDHDGHHLAAGIERGLADARTLRVEVGHAGLGGVVDEGALGGLAHGLALLGVVLGVGAQGHACKELVLVGGELVLDDGHLVLGEGAGLIGADDLGAAEGLDGGHLADDGLATGHLGDAHGENDGHDGDQALGDGGDGQGHGDHEGVEHHGRVGAQLAEVANDIHGEDDHADGEHELGQDAGKLVELHLERGELLLGAGERGGDLTHLGVHAGAHHDGTATAVHDGGAHVAHVLTVAQRHIVGALGEGDDVGVLLDRDGLAGKSGLLDLHGGALDHAAVRRHGVAGLKQDHVAGDELGARHMDHLAVADDLGLSRGHLLQRLEGLLGLGLLDHAEDGVQDDDGQDDGGVRPLGLALDEASDDGDGGRNEQHDDHRVTHLLEEALPHGSLLFLIKLVRAHARQARLRPSGRQAGSGTRGLLLENLLSRSQVLFQSNPSRSMPSGTQARRAPIQQSDTRL